MSYSKKCPGCVRQTQTLGRIIGQRDALRAESEAAKREVERLTRERDTAMNVAAGVAAERDAAYEAVTRANNARRDARSAAMEEAAGIAEREAEGAESLALGASEEQAFRLHCEAERAREIAAAIRAAKGTK